MLYQFNQAVSLNKKNYLRGIHEVPKEVESHPFFLKLVKQGLVSEPDKTKSVSKESQNERSQRLFDKLAGKDKLADKDKKADQPEKAEGFDESEIAHEDKKKKSKK